MKKLFAVIAALALSGLSMAVSADITIDTVTVGDPGNAADTADHSGNPNGQGSVAYTYNIGKYEVTAGQYCAFLNAVAKTDPYDLYNSSMWSSTDGCKIQQSSNVDGYYYNVAPDYANRPVNFVSYWDACRFANWLHNGQGNGDTETGAYALNGYNGFDGRNIQRSTEARWAITSEDEWYKAAYYKGGGTSAGYWEYATCSDYINTDMANYGFSVGHTTSVGSYDYPSAYGTFDQIGNVTEMNEAIVDQTETEGWVCRGYRGGMVGGDPGSASYRDSVGCYPTQYEFSSIGFRVISFETVPEPSSVIALLGGLTGLIGLKRRKA